MLGSNLFFKRKEGKITKTIRKVKKWIEYESLISGLFLNI